MKNIIKITLLLALFSQIAFANYSRSSFKHWIDEDGDCLNTRQEVLQKDSLESVEIQGCRVVRGKWYDVYSGQFYTQSSKLDIDHIVPLHEAWESGADKWTAKKRKEFANDYDNLVAVSRSLNRQKGAKDPAEWLPPHKQYICEYIAKWLHIKAKYNLAMDLKEQEKIKEIQGKCLTF
jgi:hypothetical protein